MSKYESFLNRFEENDWLDAVSQAASRMHEVDRNAAQIWFRFFPLALHKHIEQAEDKETVLQKFVMQGDFQLKNQIDSSHRFLYGHRYWKTVKEEIETRAESFDKDTGDLQSEITLIAQQVAKRVNASESLTLGISAIGLMILNQVGLEGFKSAKGEPEKPKGQMTKSPDQIVAERAKDDSQGFFGFLKTVDKKFTVSWIDSKASGSFQLINNEELASAAARDQSQNWRDRDERCWEGVIPVECRSASCGTCWVGVLEGEEKLSEVQRLERKQMKIFGYKQPDEAKPFLRLACQAQAHGNVSIVIPPWNAVYGSKVYGVERNVLEPVTTSAKKLREVVAEAVSDSK